MEVLSTATITGHWGVYSEQEVRGLISTLDGLSALDVPDTVWLGTQMLLALRKQIDRALDRSGAKPFLGCPISKALVRSHTDLHKWIMSQKMGLPVPPQLIRKTPLPYVSTYRHSQPSNTNHLEVISSREMERALKNVKEG
jgi:hypothetical protein